MKRIFILAILVGASWLIFNCVSNWYKYLSSYYPEPEVGILIGTDSEGRLLGVAEGGEEIRGGTVTVSVNGEHIDYGVDRGRILGDPQKGEVVYAYPLGKLWFANYHTVTAQRLSKEEYRTILKDFFSFPIWFDLLTLIIAIPIWFVLLCALFAEEEKEPTTEESTTEE